MFGHGSRILLFDFHQQMKFMVQINVGYLMNQTRCFVLLYIRLNAKQETKLTADKHLSSKIIQKNRKSEG